MSGKIYISPAREVYRECGGGGGFTLSCARWQLPDLQLQLRSSARHNRRLRKHLPMIITTLRRTLLRSAASVPFARSRPCFSCAKRQFVTSPPGAPNPATSPTASMLGTLTGELDKLAPRFEVHASQIQILQAPGEFYKTLKVIG